MNKKKIAKIILITVGTLVSLFFIATFLFLSNLGNSPSYINFELRCPTEAKNVILEKQFDQIHSCRIEEINVDNQNAKLIQITYGPARSCPTGCIYNSYAGLLHNDTLIDFSEEPNLFHVLFDKCGYWCQFEASEIRSSFKKYITYKNGNYYWAYEFNNFSNKKDILNRINEDKRYRYRNDPQYSIFNGKLIITEISSNYVREADFSKLSIELKPLEEFSPISSEELVEQCLKDRDHQTQCITEVAVAKEDPKLCLRINYSLLDLNSSQGSCIRSVAFFKKDSTICEMITAPQEKAHCYENSSEVTND